VRKWLATSELAGSPLAVQSGDFDNRNIDTDYPNQYSKTVGIGGGLDQSIQVGHAPTEVRLSTAILILCR
jgi:hypothetical protein